jgi:hypothetical protein
MWVINFAGVISFVDIPLLTATSGVIQIQNDPNIGASLPIPIPVQVYNAPDVLQNFISVFLSGLVLFSGDTISSRITYTNADAVTTGNVLSTSMRVRYTPLLRVSEQAVALLQNQQGDSNLLARLRAGR